MTTFDKLVAYFEKFPGVGIRQAKRFAFHVLTLKQEEMKELSELITSLPHSVTECAYCHSFFSGTYNSGKVCSVCEDESRDFSKLVIVATDNDMRAIERSGVYDGLYFIFGGTVPLMASKGSEQKLRTGALKALVTERVKDKKLEIILGFSINPDGENTSRFVEKLLGDLVQPEQIKISYLGRGLSTGSELEYADSETIKNALRTRN